MERFLLSLIIRSGLLSITALALQIATPKLLLRYQARSIHAAWLLIGALLVIPYQFPERVNPPVPIRISRPVTMSAATNDTQLQPAQYVLGITASKNPRLNVFKWFSAHRAAALCGVYIAGVCASLLIAAIRHLRFRRKVDRWYKPPGDTETALFNDIAEAMNVERVRLARSELITSPMLCGLFRPTVYLPVGTKLDSDELRLILRHEFTHYVRHDLWAKMLMLIAQAIHWFNPIIYWARRAESVQSELACDELILSDFGKNGRLRYVEAIIGVIRSGRREASALSTQFIGGKNSMKMRVFGIMDTNIKRAGALILIIILSAMSIAAYSIAFAAEEESQIDNAKSLFSFADADGDTIINHAIDIILGKYGLTGDNMSSADGEADLRQMLASPNAKDMITEILGEHNTREGVNFSEGFFLRMASGELDEAIAALYATREETLRGLVIGTIFAINMSPAIDAPLSDYDKAILDGDAIDRRFLTSSADSNPENMVYLQAVIDAMLDFFDLDGTEHIDSIEARRLKQGLDNGAFEFIAEALKDNEAISAEEALLRFVSLEMLPELTHMLKFCEPGLRGEVAAELYRAYSYMFNEIAAGGGEGAIEANSEYLYMQEVLNFWEEVFAF